jgi:hypothetical protein
MEYWSIGVLEKETEALLSFFFTITPSLQYSSFFSLHYSGLSIIFDISDHEYAFTAWRSCAIRE